VVLLVLALRARVAVEGKEEEEGVHNASKLVAQDGLDLDDIFLLTTSTCQGFRTQKSV